MPYIESAATLHTKILRVWAGNTGSAVTDDAIRKAWVEEAKEICEIAAWYDMKIDFEYHPNTLTDTAESAVQLMRDISMPNCGLYWQPNYKRTEAENIAALQTVLPYTDILHLFYWDSAYNRFPLTDGKEVLAAYLKAAAAKPTIKLLEFVPQDDISVLTSEANTLFDILKEAEQ